MADRERPGEVNSFVRRHPVLYAAKIAVVCALIMLVAKSAGAWLDDESVSFGRALRYVGVVFAMFFVAGSAFLVAAKRRGQLK